MREIFQILFDWIPPAYSWFGFSFFCIMEYYLFDRSSYSFWRYAFPCCKVFSLVVRIVLFAPQSYRAVSVLLINPNPSGYEKKAYCGCKGANISWLNTKSACSISSWFKRVAARSTCPQVFSTSMGCSFIAPPNQIRGIRYRQGSELLRLYGYRNEWSGSMTISEFSHSSLGRCARHNVRGRGGARACRKSREQRTGVGG